MSVNVKHDYYQTPEKVVITVMIKDADTKNCQVEIEPKKVILRVKDECDECVFHLFDEIVAERSSYKISKMKIEIFLFKPSGIHWPRLISENKPGTSAAPASTITATTSTISDTVNKWDKYIKQTEADDENKDDALNSLFQKIYQDSSDEVRRAMNKSYSESSGTVLSTNWNEVGEKPVDVRPPDGVEYKKWE